MKKIFKKLLKNHNTMSFKDELVKKVIDVRDGIKNTSINIFGDSLKSKMIEAAEEGRTRGYLHLDDEYNDYPEEYSSLEDLLGEINETKDKFIWLLEEIKKTRVFDGIYMDIEDNVLNFYWHITECVEESVSYAP